MFSELSWVDPLDHMFISLPWLSRLGGLYKNNNLLRAATFLLVGIFPMANFGWIPWGVESRITLKAGKIQELQDECGWNLSWSQLGCWGFLFFSTTHDVHPWWLWTSLSWGPESHESWPDQELWILWQASYGIWRQPKKSEKRNPLFGKPNKLPPWHSWLLFPSFLWCFTEKDWPCFFGRGMYNDGVQPEISARQRVPMFFHHFYLARVCKNDVVLAVAL